MAFLGNVGPVPGENGSWLDPDRPLLLLNRRLPVLFFLPAISRTCFMGLIRAAAAFGLADAMSKRRNGTFHRGTSGNKYKT